MVFEDLAPNLADWYRDHGFCSFDYPCRWRDGARVSLAGRNLLTVTDYSGLDPEVSNFGNQPIARNFDIAPYPPSRSFWLALSAGF